MILFDCNHVIILKLFHLIETVWFYGNALQYEYMVYEQLLYKYIHLTKNIKWKYTVVDPGPLFIGSGSVFLKLSDPDSNNYFRSKVIYLVVRFDIEQNWFDIFKNKAWFDMVTVSYSILYFFLNIILYFSLYLILYFLLYLILYFLLYLILYFFLIIILYFSLYSVHAVY